MLPGAPTTGSNPTALLLRQRSYAEAVAGRSSVLDRAHFVYIWRGAVGTPLAEYYSDPYRVIQREEKILLKQLGDRQEWVSADRFKPHLREAAATTWAADRGRSVNWSTLTCGSSLAGGYVVAAESADSLCKNPPKSVCSQLSSRKFTKRDTFNFFLTQKHVLETILRFHSICSNSIHVH